MPEESVTTRVALQIAGLDTVKFRTAMDQHGYPAPKPVAGGGANARKWSTNDLVVLQFFEQMHTAGGAPVSAATALADQLKIALLKDPDAEIVHLYRKKLQNGRADLRIRPEPPIQGGYQKIMTLPVGEWRANIRAQILQLWRADQAAKEQAAKQRAT